jgi:hypothetical protein
MTLFYLGTHNPAWLNRHDIPMFVSHRRVMGRKTLPQAVGRWACDSGGFTELSLYGEWRTTPTDYVAAIRRYRDEIGNLDWASPMDAMCEPWMLDKAKAWLGGTVEAHQRWTTDNYLTLRHIAADLPIIPVVQGWAHDDYMRHIDQYAAAGVDLTAEPTVGIGSVCRRQATSEIAAIVRDIHRLGIRMHGFGVKTLGIERYGHYLASADSMAWSFGGRRIKPCPQRPVSSCANCWHHADEWRSKVIRKLDTAQLELV